MRDAALAVSVDRKKQVKQEIAQWLAAGGNDREVEKFRDRYHDVSRASFYRWLKEARFAAGHNAAEQALQQTDAIANAAKEAKRLLPVPVSPDSINATSYPSTIQIIHRTMEHIERVVSHCYTEDGRLRNAKLLLAASGAMAKAVETLAKVAERLNDAQRIEEVHAAIFDEIGKVDPVTAERILTRLQKLRESWGMA